MYSSWVVGQSFDIFVYQHVYFQFYFCLPVCVFSVLFLFTSMCILDVVMMLMVMTINSIVPLPGAQTDSAAADSSC